MSAIDFVVRDAAGTLQRGAVAEAGGASNIIVSAGSDVSLHLRSTQILSYVRSGNALEVTLTDGRVIVLQNFFGPDGAPAADLYLSADGLLNQVELAPGEGGLYYSNYVAQDVDGKWSPNDDLYFTAAGDPLDPDLIVPDDEVGMLAMPLLGGGMMAPLLGALGLGTAAAVLGGGDDDDDNDVIDDNDDNDDIDDDNDDIDDDDDDDDNDDNDDDDDDDDDDDGDDDDPDLDILTGTKDAGHVVNREDREDGVDITGTGTPGATVTVVIEGHTQTTTVNTDGTWAVQFPPSQIDTGTYETPIRCTLTWQGQTVVINDMLVVDTEAFVTFDQDAVGGDGVVNSAEQAGIVTLTGTTEAGSTVRVTVQGQTYTAVVTGTTWTLSLAASSLTEGTYVQGVSVSAVDRYGNTASTTGSFAVDTETSVTVNTAIEGADAVVNRVEASDGIVLTGTAEAGATVEVTFNGHVRTVTATASGTWSAAFGAGTVPAGEHDVPVTVLSTDLAGNTATVSGTVAVDTIVDPFTLSRPIEGDNKVSKIEADDGIILSGTVEAGSTVRVQFGGITRTVTAGASGQWSVTIAASQIASGEYTVPITATATDLAGNTATITHSVLIDTIVNRLNMSRPVEGDNIVNRAEASDGIVLTGQVEANSRVWVTFEGVTREATVGSTGNWSVRFTAGEIPPGDYETEVTIRAEDHVGNTRTIRETFDVDTVPPEAPLIMSFTRAANGTVRAMTLEYGTDAVTVHKVDDAGNVTNAAHTTTLLTMGTPDPSDDEVSYNFSPAIPSGSHLVLSRADAAGNSTSTLFVLEESGNNTVDIGNPGYDRFNIEAIDLRLAEDSSLTITAADLEGLAAHSNALTIHGGVDDTVRALGATATGGTEVIDGKTYSVYSFGANGGTLIIDDEIQLLT